MNEFLLAAFGVAGVVGFAFYQIGYSKGHLSAHYRGLTTDTEALREAVSAAKAEIATIKAEADFYRTRCKDFDELSERYEHTADALSQNLKQMGGEIAFNSKVILGVFDDVYYYSYKNFYLTGYVLDKLYKNGYADKLEEVSMSYKQHSKDDARTVFESAEEAREKYYKEWDESQRELAGEEQE